MLTRNYSNVFKMAAFLIFLVSLMLLGFPTTASSQSPGQSATPVPGPYECKTGASFEVFDADYSEVVQVCPANKENKDGKIKSKKLYIVIHNTANPSATAILGNIRAFQNSYADLDERRSAHYIVGLNDKNEVQIIQLVKETDIAYHAGDVSKLNGQLIDNSNSIGIEVVGSGTLQGWPADAIYTAVANLVKDIVLRHQQQGQDIELNRDYIVGHEEISITGKPDPGPNWDWQRFMETELEADYVPAAKIMVDQDPDTNKITLSIEARKSTRTHYQLEISEDGGAFRPFTKIGVDGKIKNTPIYSEDSPKVYKLASYDPESQEHPVKVCYRARTLRDNYIYVNPSGFSCVVIGLPGFDYDRPDRDAAVVTQSAYPIVKPGQEVVLLFRMRNTGLLSWKPGGQYVFINTGGESFGLETRLVVSEQIWTNEEITFSLKFNAPSKVAAYTTRWQMAYIDPVTGVELFGRETGGVITVLPEGNTGGLEQIIQTIIDNAVQSANQKFEDYLESLQRRIQAEIEKQFRNLLISICPPLAPILSVVIGGGMAIQRKNRRSNGSRK
jgi:N-acetyl-anhydromuramyl-L-alanine amidase AmpD